MSGPTLPGSSDSPLAPPAIIQACASCGWTAWRDYYPCHRCGGTEARTYVPVDALLADEAKRVAGKALARQLAGSLESGSFADVYEEASIVLRAAVGSIGDPLMTSDASIFPPLAERAEDRTLHDYRCQGECIHCHGAEACGLVGSCCVPCAGSCVDLARATLTPGES